MKPEDKTDELTFDDLPPIFKECAAKETRRFALTTPWRVRGFAYATNGMICVRTPNPGRDSIGVYPKKPEALGFDASEYESEPTPLPTYDGKPLVDCDECADGVQTCGECGTSRPCEVCDGKGEAPNIETIEVSPECYLAAYFICLLRKHKARLFLPRETPGTKAYRFECDSGVEGLVMPLKHTGGHGDA